jgi:hypothetical protein
MLNICRKYAENMQGLTKVPCCEKYAYGSRICNQLSVTPHGLHPERKSLLVTPDGDYMDRILGYGYGPAGLRQSRGPLGNARAVTAYAEICIPQFAEVGAHESPFLLGRPELDGVLINLIFKFKSRTK